MRKLLFYLILSLLFLFTGCNKNNAAVNNIQKPIPVEVKSVNITNSDTSISYIGIVKSAALKKYAFKTSGKIKSINAQVGQAVKAGDILIELDKSDLQLQVDAAKNQTDAAYSQYQKALSGAQEEDVNTAKLNVEKAQAGYDYAANIYDNVKGLYAEKAISEASFNEAELNYNLAAKELEQAKELLKKAQGGARTEDIDAAKSQYELAKTNFDAISKLYNESSIASDISGYVTDILYEVGEMVPQGYPAILVQSTGQIINIGVTQNDIEKLSIGMDAKININDAVYSGKIISINQITDENSRTFSVDISIGDDNKKLYIGSIGKVEIVTGSNQGIWLEIPYILNDGVDYVYVVENNTAIRKNIKIIEIKDDKASVSGLSDKNVLITKGEKQVKDGYIVEIINNK